MKLLVAVTNYTPVMKFVCGGRGVGGCMLESLVLVSIYDGRALPCETTQTQIFVKFQNFRYYYYYYF